MRMANRQRNPKSQDRKSNAIAQRTARTEIGGRENPQDGEPAPWCGLNSGGPGSAEEPQCAGTLRVSSRGQISIDLAGRIPGNGILTGRRSDIEVRSSVIGGMEKLTSGGAGCEPARPGDAASYPHAERHCCASGNRYSKTWPVSGRSPLLKQIRERKLCGGLIQTLIARLFGCV